MGLPPIAEALASPGGGTATQKDPTGRECPEGLHNRSACRTRSPASESTHALAGIRLVFILAAQATRRTKLMRMSRTSAPAVAETICPVTLPPGNSPELRQQQSPTTAPTIPTGISYKPQRCHSHGHGLPVQRCQRGGPVFGSRSEDRRCILAITSLLTDPAVSAGTCAEMAAPIKIFSYVSSTRRAISSRLEPATCLAIAAVIDALIPVLLTGLPGSKVAPGSPFGIGFSAAPPEHGA